MSQSPLTDSGRPAGRGRGRRNNGHWATLVCSYLRRAPQPPHPVPPVPAPRATLIPMDAPLLVIVDAANVVGSVPDGWWRDRRGAAERLRDRLVAYAEGGLPGRAGPLEIVLVVEGAARGVVSVPGVRAVLAPAAGTTGWSSWSPRPGTGTSLSSPLIVNCGAGSRSWAPRSPGPVRYAATSTSYRTDPWSVRAGRRVRRLGGRRLLLASEPAVRAAVQEVDDDADDHPDAEPQPGLGRQVQHQPERGEHRRGSGSNGTHGVRKARCRSGRVRRRTITPIATTTKAKSVPMFTSVGQLVDAGEARDDRDDHAEQDRRAVRASGTAGGRGEEPRAAVRRGSSRRTPGSGRAAGSCRPW